jgi:hypothetical protein
MVPVRSTAVFASAEHRTISLEVGTVLEYQYTEDRAILLQDIQLPCDLIPKVDSAWNDEDTIQTYGILSDGSLRENFLAVCMDYLEEERKRSHDIVVKESEMCTLYFHGLKVLDRDLPTANMGANATTQHAKQLEAADATAFVNMPL